MKFRRRNAPLLLFLVPLASALSAASQENAAIVKASQSQPRDPAIADPNSSPVIDITSTKPKYDVGTKDAPVDGKDGKPHAGPFVGQEKDPKKSKPSTEAAEAVISMENGVDMVAADGSKIPAVNDGVMNDPSRQLPKDGTTGTGGGVSEKDKARKAKEGQTGERLEKKPDSPKEAPPLPEGQSKIENSRAKDTDDDDDDDADNLAGLEVRMLKNWQMGI
jgi:hypothetical protein